MTTDFAILMGVLVTVVVVLVGVGLLRIGIWLFRRGTVDTEIESPGKTGATFKGSQPRDLRSLDLRQAKGQDRPEPTFKGSQPRDLRSVSRRSTAEDTGSGVENILPHSTVVSTLSTAPTRRRQDMVGASPPSLIRDTAEFLVKVPGLETERGRQVFVLLAFGADSHLVDQIRCEGTPFESCTLMIGTCNRYGALADGRQAVVALLETARSKVGVDRAEEASRLIERWIQAIHPSNEQQQEHISVDVFLGYSRKDRSEMQIVKEGLRKAGFSVWTDEGLAPGTQSWQDAIEEAVKQVQAMVVLLSPNAIQSMWLKNEIGFAQARKKRVFPVLISGDAATAVPISLINAQWVDGRENLQQAVTQELLPTLRRHLVSPP